ncbi:peptide deformylase [Synechococcus sp. 65AY6Li]|uniref:peptide deformylase n=1 Tax=unclassified Synechococcus TaxID=2626047 RepID=UPI0000693F1D|nr:MULTISPECIES: peptide deformylase [unclassified Synechococcus]ABC98350.1 peptide deformylase [Synechococcus sp. JA-3-3Ab]PIK91492.1 peptide deformylase [Synechococcus sp. 65AY6Li]
MVATLSVPKAKLKNPPLRIHRMGDKVLRQPAKRVSQVNDEIRQLARHMLQTMYSADGIGLAAPQVGIPKRLIVVDLYPDKPEVPPLVLINPEIREYLGEVVAGQEGCLSIPGVFCEVMRPQGVVVSFKDETGRPRTLQADDLLARVIQHEIDHLNGVLFVDHVENELLLDQELRKHGFQMQDVQRKNSTLATPPPKPR